MVCISQLAVMEGFILVERESLCLLIHRLQVSWHGRKWKSLGATEHAKSCHRQFDRLHRRALAKLRKVTQWI